MALLSWSRVAFMPQISWPERSACAGVTSPLRILATLRSYSPKPIGSPCRAMVASRMMALSAAWRWISVSITSGASRVKAPSPLIGGSWPGSPSTRIGLPKLIRSRAISSPTIETSSSTMSFASAASLCGLSAKRGFFICASAWRIASMPASAAVRSKPVRVRMPPSASRTFFAAASTSSSVASSTL